MSIREFLSEVALNQPIVGLATLGGLIPLTIYAALAVRWLWNSRRYIASWNIGFKRAVALSEIKEFRQTDKLIARGASEFFITYIDVSQAITSGFTSVFNAMVFLIQTMMYLESKSSLALITGIIALLFSFQQLRMVSRARLRGYAKLVQMKHRPIQRNALALVLAKARKR